MSLDLFQTPQQQHWSDAQRVKALKRVKLPKFPDWNYGPCDKHSEPTPSCEFRACGGDFFDHQTKSIAGLFMAKKWLDASVTGAGKTNIALGLLCLCKAAGEPLKSLIVCQTPAVSQWAAEAHRFAPGLKTLVMTAKLPKAKRIAAYAGEWEVLIMGHNLMRNDVAALLEIGPVQVISDDVDPILNPGNATAKAMKMLTNEADRVAQFNATSLQTRLQQLHAATSYIGGHDMWGSIKGFENKYVKRDPVFITIKKSNGSTELMKSVKATGYKNLNDFRDKFGQMHIRHSYEDMTDIRLPEVMPPQHIWLEMYAPQRHKYEQLRAGILELIQKDQPPQQKKIAAIAAYTYGQAVCTGLPALKDEEDGPQASPKLDWLEGRLTNDWADQKVVVFARNTGTVRALQARLGARGIGFATIWGQESDSATREAEKTKFWEDPNCMVLIGTASIERSLNLHVSNLLVYLDTIPNPARMTQLLGRIRRAGSRHSHVYTFFPMMLDSQEEKYLKILGSRQLIIDAVNSEDNSEMFERLSAEEIAMLISP